MIQPPDVHAMYELEAHTTHAFFSGVFDSGLNILDDRNLKLQAREHFN